MGQRSCVKVVIRVASIVTTYREQPKLMHGTYRASDLFVFCGGIDGHITSFGDDFDSAFGD